MNPIVLRKAKIVYNFGLSEHKVKRKTFALSKVIVMLFYVHGKHLRSCQDGQLT